MTELYQKLFRTKDHGIHEVELKRSSSNKTDDGIFKLLVGTTKSEILYDLKINLIMTYLVLTSLVMEIL